MIKFVCDQCKAEQHAPLSIQIRGYYPVNAAGILLPEKCRQFEFCSHECFVAWMRIAITKEPQAK